MTNFYKNESSNIPLQLSQECVVASIQVDITEGVIQLFRKELLDFVQATRATGVILDVSGVEIMDVEEFNSIRYTINMVKIMGAIPVVSGLKPGVVAAIVELGAKTEDINAALNLDEAFALMSKLRILKNEND